MTEVHGHVEPGFEPVRDAFAANFERHGEVGAAFCLHVDGRVVADLWGGDADPGGGRPYGPDTLQLVFSTTKGAAAICAHILAERGELDLDSPVTRYWPEFGAGGKADVPVRWLLCHRAGLPTIDAELTLDEVCAVTPVVEALAAQRPFWEPGTAHGYHALTYGWLVGEVVRQVTGRTLGRFFAEEVAGPLGLEFWIGLPEAEEDRVAPLIALEQPEEVRSNPELVRLIEAVIGRGTPLHRALTLNDALPLGPAGSPFGASDSPFNTRAIHATEMPAANGITTARSLSRLYAATIGEVDGVRIMEQETMEEARKPQSEGPDRTLMVETRFGTGFMLQSPMNPLLSDGSFGHSGAGGSLGFADPESGVAFGYTMNQMGFGVAGDPRTVGLIRAIRRVLAG